MWWVIICFLIWHGMRFLLGGYSDNFFVFVKSFVGIVPKTGHFSWPYFIFVILLPIVIGYFLHIAYSTGYEVLECASCGAKFTRSKFQEKNACPWCGSDIAKRVK